jgi:Ala-tRNA(Pro) deacylase
VATEDLTQALDDAGAAYELLTHAHTESALEEAQALDLSADDVAKTLIVKTADGYMRIVVPASCRLDERKVRDVTGGSKKDVHLAAEDDLRRDYPDFELGAVPPLGGARRDPVIVDSRVKARESVVLEAGSHEQSVRVATADLVRAAGVEVADICRDD